MNTLTLPLNFSTQTALTFTSNKKYLDQMELSLPALVHEFVEKMTWNFCEEMIERYKKENPGTSFVHKSKRRILTAFGEVEIPDFEVRLKRKYQGRSAQIVFELEKNQTYLPVAHKQLIEILPLLSFRKASYFLSLFWGKTHHQRIHKHFKNFNIEEIQKNIIYTKKFYDIRRVLVWLDGFCIKTRVKRGAEVVRDTLRVAVTKVTDGHKKAFSIATGFLDESYERLFRKIVEKRDFEECICFTDGEKHIENGLQNAGVKYIQRCLFHFFYNFIGKCQKDNMSKEKAELLKNNLYKIIFLRVPYLKLIGKFWKIVIMRRLSILDDICEQLHQEGFDTVKEYILRARPYLFTHAMIYLEEGFFAGRTTNKIERLMRTLAYRMKRVGAIWSPYGAKKMANLVIAHHFNIKTPSLKPISYQISTVVVKC